MGSNEMNMDMNGGGDGDMDTGAGGGGDMNMTATGGDTGMNHNDGMNHTNDASGTTNAEAGGDHNMMTMHQMSPFLFIRSTGFFVLFREANIQSTGAFVGALLLSFVFAMLSTMLSQLIRAMEERTLSGGKFAMKVVAGLNHGLRVFLHYVAMLIVMTMNVWLILAVVAGHALGWIVYALTLHKSLRSAATTKPGCDC